MKAIREKLIHSIKFTVIHKLCPIWYHPPLSCPDAAIAVYSVIQLVHLHGSPPLGVQSKGTRHRNQTSPVPVRLKGTSLVKVTRVRGLTGVRWLLYGRGYMNGRGYMGVWLMGGMVTALEYVFVLIVLPAYNCPCNELSSL